MEKLTALVVDDEQPIRLVCRVSLEHAGFVVHEARDAPTAIAFGFQQPPDLLVVDLAMPGLDGWAVLAALGTALSEPPAAIILTAHASPENEQRAHEQGAGFLPKPFDVEELVQLAQALTDTQTTTASQAAESHDPDQR